MGKKLAAFVNPAESAVGMFARIKKIQYNACTLYWIFSFVM